MTRARNWLALATAVMLYASVDLQTAIAAGPLASSTAAPADEKADRPNILFVFADDWGRYASAYSKLSPGGPSDIIQTPNFDQLASEGVLFRNAFVNAPSCTPCRSSIISGQYFWRTGRGAILHGEWDPSIPTFPILLQDAGYKIGYSYKVWGPGTPANAPFNPQTDRYVKRGSRINQFSQAVSKSDNPQKTKKDILAEVQSNFQDFLQDRHADQPFFFWFGPTNTHRKWVKGSGKDIWGLNPDDLKGKLPSFLPDEPEVRQDFCDYLGEAQAVDAALGVLVDELKARDLFENTIVVVSGDHGIPGFPRGKCNLYDLGVRVSLAIRWGDRISKGRVVDDFTVLSDLAPTFLTAAGLPSPNVMTGRDLMPILLSDKSGLVDESRDAAIVGRERHVSLARADYLPYPQRAVRTKDFLYIRNFKSDRWPMGTGPGMGLPKGEMPDWNALQEETYAAFADVDASPTKAFILSKYGDPEMQPYIDIAFGLRPEEELYDLRSDPHHMVNIAQDPKYSEDREQLSKRLMNVLTETGDPRVIGDGDTFDNPPYAGPAAKPRKK